MPPPLNKQAKQATIENLLTCTSGIARQGSNEGDWGIGEPHKPGEVFHYNNWTFNALGGIFNQQTDSDLFKDFNNEIVKQIGMQDFNLNNTWYQYNNKIDMYPKYGFKMSARDMARFGLLYLNKGNWNGKQIIPEKWVAESTKTHVKTGIKPFNGYGYLWWTSNTGYFKEYPVYSALGVGENTINVCNKKNVVFITRVNTYNPKFKYVSYPLENPVLGKDDYSFFSQEEAKTNSEEDRKVFQTGEAILREERYIPGCRKTKWGIVSKLPVFDSENKIVGVIGTFIDITERQKSEEKLKLLEHCFDSTGQIITIADDIDRQFLYVSKASFEEITGYSINEMYNTENIEKTLSKICHSQDLHKHYYNVKWPESHSFEWRLICANKTEKILKTTVSQILSSLNNKHYTIGVSIDVTNELKIHDNQIKNLLTSEFSKLSSCFLWTAEITKNDNKQILNPRAIIDRLKHFESNLSNHQYFTIFNEASRKYLFVSNNFEKITGYSLDFFYNSTNPTPVSELCHSKDIHKHSYNSDWPEVNALSWRLICKNKKIKLLKSIKTRIRIGNNVFIIALITEVDEAQNDIILPKDKEIITDIVNNFNKSEEIKENIRINYLSDEFEFITGYSKSDFTENKQSIQSIIHPDNIEILNNWLKTQNTPTMLNFKIISSDNKTINIKSSVQSKKTEDSKTFYFGKAEVVTK